MSSPDPHGELAVFVYGTLKAGFQNHAHYCRGATRVLPASTWGRLYLWEPGVPILDVPREHLLLLGSTDLDADLLRAERTPPQEAQGPPPRRRGWRRITGELLFFPDARHRLALLDALEGFHPRPSMRYYERILLDVAVEASPYGAKDHRPAWTYVLPTDQDPPGVPLDLSDWQPGCA